ncbi:MAG: ABC transporter permease [Chloroflexota bacterium]
MSSTAQLSSIDEQSNSQPANGSVTSDLSAMHSTDAFLQTPPSELSTIQSSLLQKRWWQRVLSKLIGLIRLALYRLGYYSGLSLLALAGVILAVGLVTSAAFFSQAVDKVILTRQMAEYTAITKRPPFSARIFTASSRIVPLTMDRAETLGKDVASTLTGEVKLPLRYLGLQADSGALNLRPGSEDQNYTASNINNRVNLIYIQDVAPYMEILEGVPLKEDGVLGESGRLDVWMYDEHADEMGVQVGEYFEVSSNSTEFVIPLRVAGVWRAIDVEDNFWLSKPDQALSDKFLVRGRDYRAFVEPALEVKVRTATWQVVLDENAVIPGRVRDYAEGFAKAEGIVLRYLPDARVTLPSVSLDKFVRRQTALTTLLLGFNVPALGFLLYFLILTSTMIAYWQRRETTVLIRRGMNRFEIWGLSLVEGILLFLIGCPIGLGFGIVLARMMGYAVSFLSFTSRTPLPVSIYGINLPLVFLTLIVILAARLWAVAMVDRRNLVSQERDHVRPPQAPFWYRTYLDVLLLIPTWYGYNQLANRGSLALLIQDRPEDLFRDPLLIVLPALFILSMSLMSMRIFAVVMWLIERLAFIVPWVPLHLSLRQLGRHSHTYINPLLLVIVSLGLGIYTLSMAASLDQWLVDRMYYRTGADLSFLPYSEAEAMAETPQVGANWIPPIGEFETLAGVESAARVGDYKSIIRVATGDTRIQGRFLAIDRIEFGKVSWFRSDFAGESFGSLMNRLAPLPDGILVPQPFLERHNLHVNDRLEIQVLADFGATLNESFTIVGAYNHFPTVYEDELTVVGNLDYINNFFGMAMPHRIWMKIQDDIDGESILEIVPETGIDSRGELDVQSLVSEEQAKMERVGVFGTLSVSFLAATVMAAMGLMTYSYASLQERRFHFAILRAGGLSSGQVIGQVTLEYLILTAFGAVAGIYIGSWTSAIFVPMFRVTAEGPLIMPPLLPVIAQSEIVPLAISFAGAMIVLEVVLIGTALYRRMFDALRLGF